MGLFGGGGNSGYQGPSQSDLLIDQQFKQNQADIEQKRKRLTEERLDIIHGQAGQNWHPNDKGQ